MKIAIIGAGVAGLGAAWCLNRDHDITVYEAGAQPGGHAHSVDIACGGEALSVDTGFIVYNEANYPNLVRLFDAIGAPTAASDMSFSVSLDAGAYEYKGSAGGLLAQRRNLFSTRHWRMIGDLLRFYRRAPATLEDSDPSMSLGDYLDRNGYSDSFTERHLLPMAAAIWSSTMEDIRAFPLRSFLQFFHNHALFDLRGRPNWRTVRGGSRNYVERLCAPFAERILTGTPVRSVRRASDGVRVLDARGLERRYDQVVMATHADVTRRILGAHALPAEARVLEGFSYRQNTAYLHRDLGLMPKRRSAWASWNYLSSRTADRDRLVSVTYWMNNLQPLPTEEPVLVSLNPPFEPHPALTWGRYSYDHPQFDAAALAAQEALPTIQGLHGIWYCGSYCGYGFHEDALQSGLGVAAALGSPAPWAREVVPRSPAIHAVTPAGPFAEAAE